MAPRLSRRAQQVAHRFDGAWKTYPSFGEACSSAGSLAGETRRLVKIALAVGKEVEGAVHAHVRQALAEGLVPVVFRDVALLAMSILGLPKGVAVLSWIDGIFDITSKPAGLRAQRGSRGA